MSTVNPDEIKKFSQIANEWWDPKGPMKPLHAMNAARMQFIQQNEPLRGQKWLDVGCGGGLLSEALAQAGACVTGIDPCEAVINAANAHLATSHLPIEYIHGEVGEHNQTADYDAIACMELLEHVDDPAELLTQCKPLLKPNGSIYLSTLNRNWQSFLLGIVAAEYVLGLVPKGTHEYKQFIKPSELDAFLDTAGFTLVDITGLSYEPLHNTCKLSPNTQVNYLVKAVMKNT